MTLSFANDMKPLLVLLLLAVSLGLAALAYRRAFRQRRRSQVAWLLGMRLLAVLSLCLFLFRPVIGYDLKSRSDAAVLVLVDVSKSMTIADAGKNQFRIAAAQDLLTGPGGILPAIEESFQVRTFTFGSTAVPLEPADRAKSIPADAEITDISAALEQVRKSSGDSPIEAIVLLSDGQENGPGHAEEVARSTGVRVHAIGFGAVAGGGTEPPDLAVTKVTADRTAFVRNRVEVRASVECRGSPSASTTAELRCDNRVLASLPLALKAGSNDFSLDFTPEEAGVFEIEVRVAPLKDERITENNSRYFILSVSADKIQVFFFEATLRWEYKFVKQALEKDPTIAFTGAVKTNVDRVYAQGRASGDVAANGFPAGREALKKYDCVILGDVGPDDFLPGQIEALRAYASEEGGGVLFLGGRKAFGSGGLKGSAIEEALPVVLDGEGRVFEGTVPVRLTSEGREHPAFRGLGAYFDDPAKQAALRIETCFVVKGIKPGAQLLARGDGPGGESLILAAVQRYGEGRTAAWASDTDWKWAMSGKAQGGDALFAALWGQMVRWLAQRDDASRGSEDTTLSLTTDKDLYSAGERVVITARAPGAAAAPAVLVEENASDAALARRAAAARVQMAAVEDRFEGVFRPSHGGLYTVKATVGTGAGAVERSRRFAVERSAREFDRVAQNEDLLRKIASSSGGRYFTAETARQLPAHLAASATETVTHREWGVENSPVLFVMFVAFLSAEWALRKRMQVI